MPQRVLDPVPFTPRAPPAGPSAVGGIIGGWAIWLVRPALAPSKISAAADGVDQALIFAIVAPDSGFEEWWAVELAVPSCVTRVVIYNAWEYGLRDRISPSSKSCS